MGTSMGQSLAVDNLDFLEGLELPPVFGGELPQLHQDQDPQSVFHLGALAADRRYQHSPSLPQRGPTAPCRPADPPKYRSTEASCAVVTPGSVRSRDTVACAVPPAPAPKRSRVLIESNTIANAVTAPSTAAAAFTRAGVDDRKKRGPRGGRSAEQEAALRRKQTPRAKARAPQRPLPFNLFNREQRLELKNVHPEWGEAQRKAEIQKRWNNTATQEWFKTKHPGYRAQLKGTISALRGASPASALWVRHA